jgi:hypothetical protein
MITNPTPTDGVDFRSSEYATSSERPKLAIAYSLAPTAVMVGSYLADGLADHVLLTWTTVIEVHLDGFNLYRADSPDGPWSKLNVELIEAKAAGSPYGASYEWIDWDVELCKLYYYKLTAVSDGVEEPCGPVSAACDCLLTYLPLVLR